MNVRHQSTALLLPILACALLMPLAAWAQAPGLVNFQATLGDAGSLPAELTVTFEIRDAGADGTLLWSEQQTVTHTDGRIQVLLGSVEAFPADLFTSDGDRFLDMIVDGNALDERFQLTSVAYALRSAHADNVGPTISRGDDTRLNLYTNGNGFNSRSFIEMWGQETGGGEAPGRQGELTLAGRYISFWTGSGLEDFGLEMMRLDEEGNVSTAGAVRSNSGGFIFPDGSVQTTASEFSGGNRLEVNRQGTAQILVVNPSESDDTFPAEIFFSRSAVGPAQDAAVGVSGTERDFFIWVNNEDRLNIDAETGDVGIGTRTPTERLQIGEFDQGDRYLALKSGGGVQYRNGIKLRSFSDAFGHTIDNDDRVDSYGLNFLRHLDDVDGVSQLFLSRYGGVGIGTTDPFGALDVRNGADRGFRVLNLPDDAGEVLLGEWIGNGAEPQIRISDGGPNFTDFGRNSFGEFMIEQNDTPHFLLRASGRAHVSGDNSTGLWGQNSTIDLSVDDNDTGLDVATDGELAVYTNGNERMRIRSDGNVGIGMDSPTNILTIPQDSDTDPIADAWTTYSSRRWKSDIRTIEDPLATLMQLRGVRYTWTESGRADIGLIAEEVGAVVPEVVHFEENGVDARSVDYPRLVALLIEAVKEQQADIERLEAMVATYADRD